MCFCLRTDFTSNVKTYSTRFDQRFGLVCLRFIGVEMFGVFLKASSNAYKSLKGQFYGHHFESQKTKDIFETRRDIIMSYKA